MEKEVFDKMVVEFQELGQKTDKLREFILDKEKFEAIEPINRDLLVAQLKAMEAYLSILSIRLGLNAPKGVTEATEPVEEVTEPVSE